ncbi:hypothetical protein ABZ371_06825 [Streptomyces sp. NPDC005899]|uniref:hypothetical protein n=1 Tax=Streptomyces sp. NPDC005899 TaxID=3155716 RepID=UPI00340C3678
MRRRLHSERRSDFDVTVYLTSFHLDRLALQRSTEWIEEEPQSLADDQPEILTAKPRTCGTGTEFTILRFSRSWPDALRTGPARRTSAAGAGRFPPGQPRPGDRPFPEVTVPLTRRTSHGRCRRTPERAQPVQVNVLSW